MSYNRVILQGNMCRDVDIRMTPTGLAVGDFSIAVNRTWKDEAGQPHEECSFFNCVAFGKRAETLSEYVKKGHAILLEGRLKQETWEDKKTGEKRQAVKVIVESFTFLNQSERGRVQPSDNDEGPPARTKSATAATPIERARAESPPVDDDDSNSIPF